MKQFMILLFVLMVSACNGQNDLTKLKWLEGTWIRTDTKPGSSASESWTKISATELKGRGIEMKGSDTAFVEKIQIVMKDNALHYVADVPENHGKVFFKFKEITSSGFICENPDHDFPKKIAYKLDGRKLKATISGDGKTIDYFFTRK